MGRKICSRLLALGLLGCLTAHAGSPVWAVHGDHNTVYLAGSVHLLKANDAALPAAFERAYAGSQTLVMELDLGKVDPLQAAGWMAQHGTLPEGGNLHKAIGDERYRRVTTEAARLGLPMEMAEQFAPWVLGLQLLELQYAQLGFDSEAGVEQQLEHRAQADSKPTAG
ncbi:MAG: TraB/GumN family protein, partial [Steroidobacteraceae bacterium]